MSQVAVRQVTSPLDPAIGAFGRLQRQVYFESEMLIPPTIIRAMLGVPMTGRGNFLVLAEQDGEVIGGTFFHYMRRPNTGFSSFMGIAQSSRGQGVARKLHQARFAVLDEAAGGKTEGVFIDVVAPERLTPKEIADEHKVGSDPVHRRQVFAALGFRRVDIRYEQPVGGPPPPSRPPSPNGERVEADDLNRMGWPVTNMDLLYCPRQPAETVPTERVLGTMRAYWTPWLGVGRAEREAEKLRERAGGAELRLLPAV